jgi:hypothetical protein
MLEPWSIAQTFPSAQCTFCQYKTIIQVALGYRLCIAWLRKPLAILLNGLCDS